MNASLQTIQDQFQTYVLRGDREQPAIAALIDSQFGLPVQDRLAIYYDAYRIRLGEALAEAFDKTYAYVGDDAFAALCRDYIERYPSQFRNLRWFGDHFAAFAAESLPDHPMVAELAAFEWALGLAFDAADAPILTLQDLQGLAPEAWETLGFALHPSLQLLSLHWNIPAIWLALGRDEAPPDALRSEEPCTWLVWRKELQPHFRSLNAYEALALRGLAEGRSFSDVCSAAAETSDEDITGQIAGWLHTWMNESVLTALHLDADPT
ncbi:MAG TPA: DNA-binding domain-containing protein [Burkholderiaceae bacterium]|jgi:hypothetical protein